MPLIIHLVNTPQAGVRDAYQDAWRELDAHDLRHPDGRQLHVAWTVDDVLHVVDVWDSAEQQQAFMRHLEPILDQVQMKIDAPEPGEFLQVVQPPA
jgi:hypothetical protein